MLLTLFYISYAYAIIGVILFNDYTNNPRSGSPYTDNSYTDFNSFGGAMLALF